MARRRYHRARAIFPGPCDAGPQLGKHNKGFLRPLRPDYSRHHRRSSKATVSAHTEAGSRKVEYLQSIIRPCPSPWLEGSYKRHRRSHWHNISARRYDIEAQYCGRHPRLLFGDPQHSYLWSQPIVSLTIQADNNWKSAHHRFFDSLDAFLSILQCMRCCK